MTQTVTFHVADFEKAVSWYAGELQMVPSYIDNMWAIFAKDDVRVCLVNELGHKVNELLRGFDLSAHAQEGRDVLIDAESGEIGDANADGSETLGPILRFIPITLH